MCRGIVTDFEMHTISSRNTFGRETTLVVYVLSMVSMWIYTFTLSTGHIAVVYVTSSLLG